MIRGQIGQSLLEMVVAIGVTTLVLTSLVAAVVISIRNAHFARNQSLATKYAQEAIEKIRIRRDIGGWSSFSEGVCENPPNLNPLPYPFSRIINCTPEGGGERMKVEVNISWSEGGRRHQTQLVSYLTKWK